MTNVSVRGLLLSTAMLLALAVAAGPAQATISPVSTNFTGTSTNSQLVDNNGNVVRCPTASGSGRSSADGRSISLALTFSRSATVTCTARTGLGTFSATVTCSGLVTVTSTASTRGTSATGSITLDSGFSCSIELTGVPIIGSCTITVSGPQGPFANTATLTQADQRLRVNTGTVLNLTGNCPGAGSRAGFSGDYSVTPRFTIA